MSKKKIVGDSVLISFLKLNSNNRFRLLTESALPGYKISKEALDELVTKRLIRGTDKLGNYVITAEGVWEIESKNNSLDKSKLLEFLDKSFFSVYNASEKPLTEKEKVALFAMIAARAFSKDSSVDLKKTALTKDTWQAVLNKSLEKLKSLELVSKLETTDLYKNHGNEHPVSYVFKRINELTKKTRGIYQSPGHQVYYLDIFSDGEITKEKLKHLIKQVLGGQGLSTTTMNELDTFCREVAHKDNIYLFDTDKHLFAKPKYDEILREALLYS